ncbi:MAG TPA: DUF1932 domain-containing protein [Candidatus Binataceae bacterium]|nr:DUF1932 domain-containing protein [Candidatus Binataceae bacterium]
MTDSKSVSDTIAIIGAGEMGAAVGRRMREAGARVLTSLKGRSAASAERTRLAGLEVIDDDEALVGEAGFVLSIVPPGVAYAVAERLRAPLTSARSKPIFVECNAISPATVRRIADLLAGTGCRFVDAGIIGGPPPAGRTDGGPRIYASGPDAPSALRLREFGLDIRLVDGPVGAASGLKMSYAGLTKGLTALGAAMIAAASRNGLAMALREELERSQPGLLASLGYGIPSMFPKAYRWVAEMEQIADFLGGENRGSMIYQGVARLYADIAAQSERGGGWAAEMASFFAPRK